MVYLKSVENVITLGTFYRPVVFILSPPPLYFFLKTKRNDLARPVMGTIFLVYTRKWFPLRGERAHCLKLFCM